MITLVCLTVTDLLFNWQKMSSCATPHELQRKNSMNNRYTWKWNGLKEKIIMERQIITFNYGIDRLLQHKVSFFHLPLWAVCEGGGFTGTIMKLTQQLIPDKEKTFEHLWFITTVGENVLIWLVHINHKSFLYDNKAALLAPRGPRLKSPQTCRVRGLID